MSKLGRRITAIMILGSMFLLMNVFTVWGDETPGSIHGVVFIDEDGNCLYDPGEPVLEGVTIELTNGEIILETKSDGDGAFTFSVGPGVWQGVIYPPLGYSVLNDATREVVIEPGGSLEAVLNFALTPEAEAESVEAGSENAVQTEYYEGEAPVSMVAPDDSSDQGDPQSGILGVILPESGFPIPLKWALGVVVLVILLVGASLIFLGRRLQR